MKYVVCCVLLLFCSHAVSDDVVEKVFVPSQKIETFAPHNRITDELVVPVTFIKVRNSNNAFVRKNIVLNGQKFQQIIVNGRIVSVVPVQQIRFLNHNHVGNAVTNNNFVRGYGTHVGFLEFDYLVNNQFFHNQNLVRQVVVNNKVVLQEIVPSFYAPQFISAFNTKNFVLLQQIRSSGHCRLNIYR